MWQLSADVQSTRFHTDGRHFAERLNQFILDTCRRGLVKREGLFTCSSYFTKKIRKFLTEQWGTVA